MAINPQKLQNVANKYITEFIRCKTDFKYFCSKYILLELPGGDQPLNLYDKQYELVQLIEKEKFVIVLKSRQIGISTCLQSYATWLAIFYDNAVIGIISKDGKEATHFARTIRGMIEKLPNWMKPPKGILGRGFSKRTEQSFILTNGSKVISSPVNPNAPEKTLRGQAITFLIVDEGAFILYLEKAWTSMVPALSTNQSHARKMGVPYGTVVLSTPNKTVGIGKWYYNRYMNSLSGHDIFKPFIIHWKMVPELADDPDWYETQCRLFEDDPRKIQQELELKFLPSEGSFFEASTVETMQDSTKKAIEITKLYNGECWKFIEPIKGAYYLIGVDTASEHGQDKSAITIWDWETMEQVWEYRGKCKVLDFVKVVKVACAIYRNGTVVIESNSYGNQVVESMLDSPDYTTMVYKEKRGKDTLVGGLSTNSKTRPLMIDALYSYVSQFPEIVKSERLALELTGLVSKKNGKVEADDGSHDDLCMASACAFFVRKYDSGRIMVNSERLIGQSVELSEIININTKSIMQEFSNPNILKHIKDNMDEYQGFIDVLSLYDKI